MSTAANPPLETLPDWARELSEKYYSRTLSMFAIHGNVRDIVPLRRPGAIEFPSLHQFLREALFGRRDLVFTYERGGGLSFARPDMQADFRAALSGYDAFHGSNYTQALPRNPDGVLNMLESYLRVRVADGKTIAVILDFAETIAPAGDGSTMGSQDRNTIVILKRWAQNLTFLRADVTISSSPKISPSSIRASCRTPASPRFA